MSAEHAVSVLIPLLVLAVLWTVVRHWILPFVLGFALAVALGPSARPLMAGAWEAVASVGGALFGARSDLADPRERYLDRERYSDRERSSGRRGPGPSPYDDE